MAGLMVEEYANLHFQEGSVFPIPGKLLVVTAIVIGADTELAQVFNTRTRFVNLTAEAACHFNFGVFGAASATVDADRFLPAGASRFFAVDNVDGSGTETSVAAIATN